VPDHRCANGWVCEFHPDQSMHHDDCGGAGAPCPDCNWLAHVTPPLGAMAAIVLSISTLDTGRLVETAVLCVEARYASMRKLGTKD
jgi:hypothetical protein